MQRRGIYFCFTYRGLRGVEEKGGLVNAETWDDLVRLGLVTADIIVQDIVGRDSYVIYVYYRGDKKLPEDAVEYARRRDPNIKLIKQGD